MRGVAGGGVNSGVRLGAGSLPWDVALKRKAALLWPCGKRCPAAQHPWSRQAARREGRGVFRGAQQPNGSRRSPSGSPGRRGPPAPAAAFTHPLNVPKLKQPQGDARRARRRRRSISGLRCWTVNAGAERRSPAGSVVGRRRRMLGLHAGGLSADRRQRRGRVARGPRNG